MKPILAAIALFALAGCEPDKPNPYEATVYAPPEGPSQRFKVELQGVFHAGYQNNRRDIVILTDTTTGEKYLAITGCGVTELHNETRKAGKTTHTVQVEE